MRGIFLVTVLLMDVVFDVMQDARGHYVDVDYTVGEGDDEGAKMRQIAAEVASECLHPADYHNVQDCPCTQGGLH